MNRKVIFIVCVCLALLLVGCGARDKNPSAGEAPAQSQEQSPEESQIPTEEKLPGLVDSIFDDLNVEDTGNQAAGENQTADANPGEETTSATEPPYAESQPAENSGEMTYEKYNAMSGEEQMAFFSTFASVEDFVAWHKAAKEKYEAENPAIEIEDGEIDLDSIFGGN